MTVEIVSLVIQGVIAVGSLALVYQLYLFRRAGKYETCQRLHEFVGSSDEMARFHTVLQQARTSRETARNLFAALDDTAAGDVEKYREGAEAYARFLRYLFYIIKEDLVDKRDAGEIVGELISEYYQFRERMNEDRKQEGLSRRKLTKYFPEVPGKLMTELRRRYGPDWPSVYQGGPAESRVPTE